MQQYRERSGWVESFQCKIFGELRNRTSERSTIDVGNDHPKRDLNVREVSSIFTPTKAQRPHRYAENHCSKTVKLSFRFWEIESKFICLISAIEIQTYSWFQYLRFVGVSGHFGRVFTRLAPSAKLNVHQPSLLSPATRHSNTWTDWQLIIIIKPHAGLRWNVDSIEHGQELIIQ